MANEVPVMIKLPPNVDDVFSAQPHEILASREASHWSRCDLARVIGVGHNLRRRHCATVERWEKGSTGPHPLSRDRLAQRVILFRDQYASMLAKLSGTASRPSIRNGSALVGQVAATPYRPACIGSVESCVGG